VPASVRVLLAAMLLIGCLRSALALAYPPHSAQQFFDELPNYVPDLATASTAELCTLPAIGPGRAAALQSARAKIAPPWTAARLAQFPGLGPVRATQLANALAVQGSQQGGG